MTNTPALAHDAQVPLWPAGAPGALGDRLSDIPALTVHLPPAGTANGTAVIVNPGGGYRILASDHEGLQVARWLNRLGIAAFVLRYRLGERYDTRTSLADGQRAVRFVRHHAAALGISPRRIGMLGFSAGGHLTVAVGTAQADGDAQAADPIDRHSARPDFLVPVYAVTNGIVRGKKADEYFPTDTRVNASTPPTFLVHTHEDELVSAEQSLLFYRACLAAGVPAELHVFGYGEHGVGLATGDPDTREWMTLLQRWLRRTGLLTDRPRVQVRGRLQVGGKQPGMAWVTLLPEDSNAPIARACVNSQGIGETGDGAFVIDATHGPAEGPHRVEVHWVSKRNGFDADGAYTLDDAHVFTTHVHIAAATDVLLQFERPA
jgi:acetyl esterase/lipase